MQTGRKSQYVMPFIAQPGMGRLNRRGGARRRGISLIEMALVLPLLLLLIFGVIEYSWMFLKSQQATHAAREGVRRAILPDTTVGEIETVVQQRLEEAGMADSGHELTIDPEPLSDVQRGDPVRVHVRVPYQQVRLIGGGFLPGPEYIGGGVTMAKEGPG